MRKIKLVSILLLSLMVTLGMGQAVFADSNTADGGTYTYNGDVITDEAGQTIDDAISGMEPGDDLTIDFTYTNGSDATTYWYMENTIVKTLEEASDAADGGYSYKLTNSGPGGSTVIFDSDAVGGDKGEASSSDAASEGLKAATDATDEWFFIQELGAGESGHTELYVALDGESEVNSYMDTDGQLEVNYAVEEQPPGEDTIIDRPPTTTKTGDTFNPLFAIAALTAALLAALLAVLSYFRDRKDGEEA